MKKKKLTKISVNDIVAWAKEHPQEVVKIKEGEYYAVHIPNPAWVDEFLEDEKEEDL